MFFSHHVIVIWCMIICMTLKMKIPSVNFIWNKDKPITYIWEQQKLRVWMEGNVQFEIFNFFCEFRKCFGFWFRERCWAGIGFRAWFVRCSNLCKYKWNKLKLFTLFQWTWMMYVKILPPWWKSKFRFGSAPKHAPCGWRDFLHIRS